MWQYILINGEDVWPINTSDEEKLARIELRKNNINSTPIFEILSDPESVPDGALLFSNEKITLQRLQAATLSAKQRGFIRILAKKLNFKSSKHAVESILGRVGLIDNITPKQAGLVINRLKTRVDKEK